MRYLPQSRDWPLLSEQEPPLGAKAIKLTKGYVAWVDECDYESLTKFVWTAQVGQDQSRCYAARFSVRDTIMMHRVIMSPESNMQVDHVKHLGLSRVVDNRRCNLRICTGLENRRHRRTLRKGKSSRFKGVSLYRGRLNPWSAYISSFGKKIHLGFFQEEHYAALAYDYAARKYHGEFALTNFPTVEGRLNELVL